MWPLHISNSSKITPGNNRQCEGIAKAILIQGGPRWIHQKHISNHRWTENQRFSYFHSCHILLSGLNLVCDRNCPMQNKNDLLDSLLFRQNTFLQKSTMGWADICDMQNFKTRLFSSFLILLWHRIGKHLQNAYYLNNIIRELTMKYFCCDFTGMTYFRKVI